MKSKHQKYLTCIDHFATQQQFDLIYNKQFDLLETHPKPSKDKLLNYYKSDNYISHTDANNSLLDKIYHFVKKITISNKIKNIKNYKKDNNLLLDIGCGTGEFLIACKNDGWNCIGIEPNLKARTLANSKLNSQNVIKENLDKLIPKYHQKFDVITMWHVLEHILDINKYILDLKRLLKPNGILIVAVPNYKSYDANFYKQFWAAYDVPRHIWHFSKKSIKLLFESQEMKLIKYKPMLFDSFYVSILSEKYKNSKNNYIKAFFIGLWSNCKGLITKEYSSHTYFIKKN